MSIAIYIYFCQHVYLHVHVSMHVHTQVFFLTVNKITSDKIINTMVESYAEASPSI